MAIASRRTLPFAISVRLEDYYGNTVVTDSTSSVLLLAAQSGVYFVGSTVSALLRGTAVFANETAVGVAFRPNSTARIVCNGNIQGVRSYC